MMGGEDVKLVGVNLVAKKRAGPQGKKRDGVSLQRRLMCLVNLRLDGAVQSLYGSTDKNTPR